MAQEAAVPASIWGRIQKMIDDSIARYARSGALQNSSITGGQGLTIGPGSKMVVQHPSGSTLMLMGAYDITDGYNMPDGSRQPMALIARADGTLALGMYDPAPTGTTPRQFLALYDRSGNVLVSDDTNSGQGMARPYVGGALFPARYVDMTVGTASTSWDTLWQGTLYKQHPRLTLGVSATMDTSGATGQVRVMVNGVQLDATKSVGFAIQPYSFTGAVAGAQMSSLLVQVQAQVVSGGGSCKVVPYLQPTGLQS